MPRARRQPQPGRRPDARRNHVPLVRTRPHAAAVPHGPAHRRRKQEGATQFPTIGLFERNANNFKGTRNMKAQKSWSSRAEPEVRIHLPPGESRVRTCMLAELDQTGESQISLTDPDSRAMSSTSTRPMTRTVPGALLKLTDGRDRVVRHGHGPHRAIQTGVGPVEVRRAKVRDRGEVGAEGRLPA